MPTKTVTKQQVEAAEMKYYALVRQEEKARSPTGGRRGQGLGDIQTKRGLAWGVWQDLKNQYAKQFQENASSSTTGAGSVATVQQEHITGEDNSFEITINSKKVVGFLEANGATIDAVVVLGTYEIIKGASKEELIEKVRAAASRLAGVKEDVLLPPEQNPNADDDEAEEVDDVTDQVEDEELMELRRRLG